MHQVSRQIPCMWECDLAIKLILVLEIITIITISLKRVWSELQPWTLWTRSFELSYN